MFPRNLFFPTQNHLTYWGAWKCILQDIVQDLGARECLPVVSLTSQKYQLKTHFHVFIMFTVPHYHAFFEGLGEGKKEHKFGTIFVHAAAVYRDALK